MDNAIGGFDHALIGVNDLEAAKLAYERLGFTACPRGRHIGWGTANYCIMFEDDYLELLGIVDASQFTNNLDVFLKENGEGLLGMAFAGPDADKTYQVLKDLGAQPPKDLSRLLELPEGTVEPRFKLVHVPAEATPGLRGFFCQHLTPEMMRRPEWLIHANGSTGLASATIGVSEIDSAATSYARIFGETGPVLHLVDTAEPGLLEIAIRSANLSATEQYLKEVGVSVSVDRDGLVVDPEEACGAVLRFVS